MDSRQLLAVKLVASAEISPQLRQRLREELARDPDAVNNMRYIAARALENGRVSDAFLVGKEARILEQMAISQA